MSEMYQVSTGVGLVSAFEHTSWKHFIFKVFRGFQCVAINIEGWLKICTPYLIYSQILLDLSRDNCHFFSTSSYGWLLLRLITGASLYIHQTNIGINNTAFSPNSSIAFWCIIITKSLQILSGALEQSTPISTLQFMSTN
jgi:hypothetical protein